MKKSILIANLFVAILSMNAQAEWPLMKKGERTVGYVDCRIHSGKKQVNQSFTDAEGYFESEFEYRIGTPINMPEACIENPDYCEGGPVRTAQTDQYITINNEKVRYILNYSDGHGSVELRVGVGAAYTSGPYSLLNGSNVSLQYGGNSYSLYCYEKLIKQQLVEN